MMPSLEGILAFAIVAFLLVVVPGPGVLFVGWRSLALGRRNGLLSVLGNELGGIPLLAGLAFRVGSVVSSSIAISPPSNSSVPHL